MIRKSFRIILWITLMLVFLFIAVALLIQLPAIQTKIVQQATTFVSKKTHTLVELEKVSISFPKTVIVEGLYLEDTQKDTLIYARRAKVNMALIDLLSGKITINAVMLNDATVNLYNFHDSPEFNYNFLTTAFSDTTAEVKTDTLTKTGMAFSLNKVSLRNFRLLYNDNYAAMNVTIGIKKSDFNVDQIDLGKSIYQIDQLQLDGLTAL
ncbi:MAG: AsmA family protein, partial [Prolixibacteraceae bacterium]|nr:AsmA family protein [Prolixibacteraceae bacterium]